MKIYIFLLIIISSDLFGQAKGTSTINVKFEELLKLKVDEDTFEFGWLPDSYQNIPCYRDYRKNTLQTKLVNSKNEEITLKGNPTRNSLKISPTTISLNKNDSTFTIKGRMTGQWEDPTPNEFEIYVGKRIDTTSNITLRPSLHGDVYYNDKIVTETIIIDTVPAFYLKSFKKFKVTRGPGELIGFTNKEMFFDISVKIDRDSIIVFGLSSCYSEIFEIGKLLDKKIYKPKR